MEKGKLYIVSTPIGNLSDITLHALEILKTVDYIIAEDTRETGKLLTLLNLPRKQLISYREQNHERALPQIKAILDRGIDMALTSDRGTPLISDPGDELVKDLAENDYEIISVPGPSSVIAALTVSGLPTGRFTFLGFLPRTRRKQIKILEKFAELESTFIIFESPFRIKKTLENIREALGEIDICLVGELTKKHEKIIRGKTSIAHQKLLASNTRGEWIILGRK